MRFGRFELIHRLHVGRIAETFLARSLDEGEDDQLLIVKRLLPELKENARFAQIFQADGEFAMRLDHPNIVRVLALEDVEGWPALLVEHLDGLACSSLMDQCRSSGLELSGTESVFIINEVLKALGHLHELRDASGDPLGLLHGELGQECVYVTSNGLVKIDCIGAGDTKHHNLRASALTNKARTYRMAPEQVLGTPIDQRVDLFNTAVMLVEFFIRGRLFDEKSHLSTLLAIRDVKLRPLKESQHRLPPRMEPILLQALSKEPNDRFASTSEFIEALKPFEGFLSPEELQVEIAELISALGPREHNGEVIDEAAPDAPTPVPSPDPSAHLAELRRDTPIPTPVMGEEVLPTEEDDEPMGDLSLDLDEVDEVDEADEVDEVDDIHTRPTPIPKPAFEPPSRHLSPDLEFVAEAGVSARPSKFVTVQAPPPQIESERPTVMASDETLQDLVQSSEFDVDDTPRREPPTPKPTPSQRILYTPEPTPAAPSPKAPKREEPMVEVETGQADSFWEEEEEDISTLSLPIGEVMFRRADGSLEGPYNFPAALDKIFIGAFEGNDEAAVDGGPFEVISRIPEFEQYLSPTEKDSSSGGLHEVEVVLGEDAQEDSKGPWDDISTGKGAITSKPEEIVSERGRDEPMRQGFLDVEPVSRILYELRLKYETCLVVFEHGPIKKDVFLHKGDPIHVHSNISSETLSEHLIRRGVISRMELEMAMAMKGKFNNSLGETLVGLGLMEAAVFVGLTRDHIRSVLIDLFKWNKGEYRVFPNRSAPELMVRTGLPTFSIILEGLRNTMTLGDCESWVHSHRGDVVHRQMSPEEMLKHLKLPDVSTKMLRSLKVPRSLMQLVDDHGSDKESRYIVAMTLRLAEELAIVDIMAPVK